MVLSWQESETECTISECWLVLPSRYPIKNGTIYTTSNVSQTQYWIPRDHGPSLLYHGNSIPMHWRWKLSQSNQDVDTWRSAARVQETERCFTWQMLKQCEEATWFVHEVCFLIYLPYHWWMVKHKKWANSKLHGKFTIQDYISGVSGNWDIRAYCRVDCCWHWSCHEQISRHKVRWCRNG